ncbi:MAG TPA: (Fe-S)-binding protein [Candidatus Deferrimicrobium sp.]|nr:(Fe-S)-binding protein [Candidatus Deferrimicrobium sp.]
MAKLSAFQLYNLTPKTNCKECGESSCMAFAVKLLSNERHVEECPYLLKDNFKSNYKQLKELLAPAENALETGITLDSNLCTGCGNCVVACPPNARVCEDCKGGMGPNPENNQVIFRVVDSKAEIQNIKICRRYTPPITNCRVCELMCPTQAIQILR